MTLDARKMGHVRSVPDMAAKEQVKAQEIARLQSLLDELSDHAMLISSDLWGEVVKFLNKREIKALDALAHGSDERELFRLQGEIRVYKYLMRQEQDLANAKAAYEARIKVLKGKQA